MIRRTAALALLLLAACGSGEPESAANRFARTSNELIAREQALNAQVENELSQTEQRLDAEAAQALNSLNAAAANAAEEPAPAAAENRARAPRSR
jgi:small-conductance mechanosensitive channel